VKDKPCTELPTAIAFCSKFAPGKGWHGFTQSKTTYTHYTCNRTIYIYISYVIIYHIYIIMYSIIYYVYIYNVIYIYLILYIYIYTHMYVCSPLSQPPSSSENLVHSTHRGSPQRSTWAVRRARSLHSCAHLHLDQGWWSEKENSPTKNR
jgi:hypothetical protein